MIMFAWFVLLSLLCLIICLSDAFRPHNAVKRCIAIRKYVCPSVSHTRGSRLNGSRYPNTFCTTPLSTVKAGPIIRHLSETSHWYLIIGSRVQASRPTTSKWLKLGPYYLREKCMSKNVVYENMWFMVIFSECMNALKTLLDSETFTWNCT